MTKKLFAVGLTFLWKLVFIIVIDFEVKNVKTFVGEGDQTETVFEWPLNQLANNWRWASVVGEEKLRCDLNQNSNTHTCDCKNRFRWEKERKSRSISRPKRKKNSEREIKLCLFFNLFRRLFNFVCFFSLSHWTWKKLLIGRDYVSENKFAWFDRACWVFHVRFGFEKLRN